MCPQVKSAPRRRGNEDFGRRSSADHRRSNEICRNRGRNGGSRIDRGYFRRFSIYRSEVRCSQLTPDNSESNETAVSSSLLRRNRVANDVKPLYEELKTVYDWSDDEVKIKPRIKGDQRLRCEPSDRPDPAINVIVESSADQTENTKLHGADRASGKWLNVFSNSHECTCRYNSDSSPNLLPLLLVHGVPGGGEEAAGKSYLVESSEQLGNPAASNVSRSNYFALKSTDDMFKGGPEQANSTEEKLRGPSGGIGAGGESRVQKVKKET